MSARTALFVLGMHRSGTSALTRVFSLSGAALPLDIYPAGVGNETGHWEPTAAIRLNDRILEAAGTSVNGMAGPSDDWFTTPAAQAFVPEITRLFLTEYGDAPLTVIKDPRVCLVFPLWRSALQRLSVACKAVVITRNPAEVALSLSERQKRAGEAEVWSADRAGLLWLRYVLACERHTRGIERSFCGYDELLDDWRGVVGRIGCELDLIWPRGPAEAGGDVDGFLMLSRRHHHETEAFKTRPGAWSFWIAPVFDELRAAARGKRPNEGTCDAVARAFEDVRASLFVVETSAAVSPLLGLKVMSRVTGHGPPLCFVGGRFWRDGEDRAATQGMFAAALDAGIDLSVVEPEALDQTDWSRLQAFAERHGLQVEVLEGDEIDIQPEALAISLQVLRYARRSGAGVLVFQDQGSAAYAAMAAKHTDLALSQTVLAMVVEGGASWARASEGGLPSDLTHIVGDHLERRAIELADVVIQARPDVADWMRGQGWSIPNRSFIIDAHAGDGHWQAAVNALLALAEEPRAARSPTRIDTTVIIAHFEQPSLLDQTLQALAGQTDQDFTILIVDDGSSSAEARRYLDDVVDRHPTLILSVLRQPNRYVGAARNLGIAAADSEFVILLDDDNVPLPHMVETLKRAVATSGADVATCGVKHFADLSSPNSERHSSGREQYFTAGPLLLGAVHNCFGDVTGIYRKAAFDIVGGFHEIHGVTFEDWQWHLRAVAAGLKLVSVPEILLWYRVRSDSMLRTTDDRKNVGVIQDVVSGMSAGQLAPLTEFLIGSERHQVRLNAEVASLSQRLVLERTVAQVALIAPPMHKPAWSLGGPPQRAEGLVVTPWEQGYDVRDLESDRTHRLDAYASVLFALCDGVARSMDFPRAIQVSTGGAEPPIDEIEARLCEMAQAGLIVL